MAKSLAWIGKGLRGPLRNAILADAVDAEDRGKAFGFHRAGDTLGAIAGPLLGAALIAWMPARWFADQRRTVSCRVPRHANPRAGCGPRIRVLIRENGSRPSPACGSGHRSGCSRRASAVSSRRCSSSASPTSRTYSWSSRPRYCSRRRHGLQAAAATAVALYALRTPPGQLAAFPAGRWATGSAIAACWSSATSSASSRWPGSGCFS